MDLAAIYLRTETTADRKDSTTACVSPSTHRQIGVGNYRSDRSIQRRGGWSPYLDAGKGDGAREGMRIWGSGRLLRGARWDWGKRGGGGDPEIYGARGGEEGLVGKGTNPPCRVTVCRSGNGLVANVTDTEAEEPVGGR